MPHEFTSDVVDRFLRLLTEQSLDYAFILLDREGRIRYWSTGAQHIFGYQSDEVIGKPVSVLFTPEDNDAGLADHELETADKSRSAEDDRWLRRADGSRFWASGVATALRDRDGNTLGYVKLLRSRTEVWEQLEALRNHRRVTAERDRQRELFLANMSQELRAPLSGIVNAAELLRMSGAAESTTLSHPLRILERQAEALHRLVDDMRDLARAGAGKIELHPRVLPINDIIRAAVHASRARLNEYAHRVTVLVPDAPLYVDVDPDRMEQVFVHLLTNAAKYTPSGGQIWVKATSEGAEVAVHIEDNGAGIPSSVLPEIFEVFTKLEPSIESARVGLDVGLSLVQSIVTLHGGTVQAQSDGKNKGSRFSVRLPLVRQD